MKIDFHSPVVILIIILVLIAAIYFGYKMFFEKKKDEQKKDEQKKVNNDLDMNAINKALTASNITTTQENFADSIVFDSIDKINQNFNYLMNTYFPSLEVDKIDTLLPTYGVSKTAQEVINEKKLNVFTQVMNDLSMPYLLYSVYARNNKTQMILLGLYFITIITVNNNEYKSYYFNDYDEEQDMIIYCAIKSYDVANIKKTAIDFVNEYSWDNIQTKPLKISLNKFIRNKILETIKSLKKLETIESVTDANLNEFITILNQNNNNIINLARLSMTTTIMASNNKNDLTTDSQIINDLHQTVVILQNSLKTFKAIPDATATFPEATDEELKRDMIDQIVNSVDESIPINDNIKFFDGINYTGAITIYNLSNILNKDQPDNYVKIDNNPTKPYLSYTLATNNFYKGEKMLAYYIYGKYPGINNLELLSTLTGNVPSGIESFYIYLLDTAPDPKPIPTTIKP